MNLNIEPLMSLQIKNSSLLPALLIGLGLTITGRAAGQTLTPLHPFALNGTDGANPAAGLIVSGSTLYGTASAGVNPGGYSGTGSGTLFALGTGGGSFTNVYSFTADASPAFTNSDGADPQASLILSGNTLYGTASIGGSNLAGTVFSVNVNGSNFTTLHTFTGGNDGGGPYSGLVLAGGTLYGSVTYGGASNFGALFALSTNGQNFTNIYSFTNANEASPIGNLLLAGGTLYGTASGGNGGGFGSVFAIGTNGLGYTNLHSFSPNSGFPNYTNKDGSAPEAGLILVGNLLYGTASQSGLHGSGVIFAVSTNGLIFTNLYNFTTNSGSPATNGDGANPRGGLVLVSNTLYGTTYNGGLSSGTIFAIGTNGLGFTNLHSFTLNDVFPYTNSDGAHPNAGLIFSGNALFGTATGGGNPDSFTGSGTVFSLAIGPATISPPTLSILRSGTNVILTWPTNASGFNLEFATNLVSPATWNTNLPAPVVVNSNNMVTNPVSGVRKFYRLFQ
jgi:uncharacterized repeat protein (TIGR03803 family)